jgi:hypothetical protein
MRGKKTIPLMLDDVEIVDPGKLEDPHAGDLL